MGKAKKSDEVGTTTGLTAGFKGAAADSGGIQANAHPDLLEGPKLGNPITQIGGLIKRLFPPKATGNSSVDRHNQRAYDFAKAERDSARKAGRR